MTEEKKKWETKPNTGSAFPNKRKQKDTHPDFVGDLLVVEPGLHWLNIWVKQMKNGEQYFSVSLNPKEERGAIASQPVTITAAGIKPQPTVDTSDDAIPF